MNQNAASEFTAPSPTKVKVSERALMARLKRRLYKEGEFFKKCNPNSQWRGDLGAYYSVDFSNGICRRCDNLAEVVALAREFGVMQDWEVLAE